MHSKVDFLCMLLWFTISFLQNPNKRNLGMCVSSTNICLCLVLTDLLFQVREGNVKHCTKAMSVIICTSPVKYSSLLMPERASIFRTAPSTQRFSPRLTQRSLSWRVFTVRNGKVVFQFSELNICIKRTQSGKMAADLNRDVGVCWTPRTVGCFPPIPATPTETHGL